MRTGPLSALAGALLLIGCGASSEPQPAPIHPGYTVTAAQLEEVLAELDPASADRIRERSQVFLELMAQMLVVHPSLYVLVDKQHALASDYVPDDLVALDDYPITTNRAGHHLSRRIMPDLMAMVETARNSGLELLVSSAYRSYDYQERVYRRHVADLGTAEADRVSARPGHSQHQLGTTVDFGSISVGYGTTVNGRWMASNAWRFGFSLSYPADAEELTGYRYEPWHFRYVGRVGTRLEREFFAGQQQIFLEFVADWAAWFIGRRTEGTG